MSGFDNEIVYAVNFDFSGQANPAATMVSDGQILIGSTALNGGGTHCNIGTITAGAGINVVNGPGTITISAGAPPGGVTWNRISASQTMAVDNGYICVSPGGALALLLPAVSALGDMLEITLDGATSFSITQGAGQQVRYGNVATTAGVGGSITSTQQGDTIRLVCQTANLKWNALSSLGNLTVA